MLPRTPPSPPPPPPAATAQKLGRVENSAAAVKIDAGMARTWAGPGWGGRGRTGRLGKLVAHGNWAWVCIAEWDCTCKGLRSFRSLGLDWIFKLEKSLVRE